jgi:hypothetical protein
MNRIRASDVKVQSSLASGIRLVRFRGSTANNTDTSDAPLAVDKDAEDDDSIAFVQAVAAIGSAADEENDSVDNEDSAGGD